VTDAIAGGHPAVRPSPELPETTIEISSAESAQVGNPKLGPETFTDRIRMRLAYGLLLSVFVIAMSMLGCVASGLLTPADARELALVIATLFGLVSPIIAFYFARAN
jgi:hypothetical protein